MSDPDPGSSLVRSRARLRGPGWPARPRPGSPGPIRTQVVMSDPDPGSSLVRSRARLRGPGWPARPRPGSPGPIRTQVVMSDPDPGCLARQARQARKTDTACQAGPRPGLPGEMPGPCWSVNVHRVSSPSDCPGATGGVGIAVLAIRRFSVTGELYEAIPETGHGFRMVIFSQESELFLVVVFLCVQGGLVLIRQLVLEAAAQHVGERGDQACPFLEHTPGPRASVHWPGPYVRIPG